MSFSASKSGVCTAFLVEKTSHTNWSRGWVGRDCHHMLALETVYSHPLPTPGCLDRTAPLLAGQAYNFPENSGLPPQPSSSPACLPCGKSFGHTAPGRNKYGHFCLRLQEEAWAGMGWGWRKEGGSQSGLGICSSSIQILFLHLDILHPDQPPPIYPASGR